MSLIQNVCKNPAQTCFFCSHLFPILCVCERFDIVLVCPERAHTEALVGIPHLDCGVGGGADQVLATATQLDIVYLEEEDELI